MDRLMFYDSAACVQQPFPPHSAAAITAFPPTLSSESLTSFSDNVLFSSSVVIVLSFWFELHPLDADIGISCFLEKTVVVLDSCLRRKTGIFSWQKNPFFDLRIFPIFGTPTPFW